MWPDFSSSSALPHSFPDASFFPYQTFCNCFMPATGLACHLPLPSRTALRKFCCRFSATTPPALTLLSYLSVYMLDSESCENATPKMT